MDRRTRRVSARTQRLLIALTLAIAIVIALALLVPEGSGSGQQLDDELIRDDYPVVVPDDFPPPTYPDSGS